MNTYKLIGTLSLSPPSNRLGGKLNQIGKCNEFRCHCHFALPQFSADWRAHTFHHKTCSIYVPTRCTQHNCTRPLRQLRDGHYCCASAGHQLPSILFPIRYFFRQQRCTYTHNLFAFDSHICPTPIRPIPPGRPVVRPTVRSTVEQAVVHQSAVGLHATARRRMW